MPTPSIETRIEQRLLTYRQWQVSLAAILCPLLVFGVGFYAQMQITSSHVGLLEKARDTEAEQAAAETIRREAHNAEVLSALTDLKAGQREMFRRIDRLESRLERR